MPEREFELYLSLLTRFLRLQPGQRAEIADELRDHLDERLQELTATGMPRDAAIRQALEELGDASLLASDFTSITFSRRRSLVMRWTARTIATLTAVILLTFALWPVPNQIAPQPAIAQPEATVDPPKPQPAGDPDEATAATKAKLAQKLVVTFDQNPFEDCMKYIADAIEVDLVIDKKHLEDEGIDTAEPLTFSIKNPLTVQTILEVLLEPMTLTFLIRDGLLVITTREGSAEVEVYDCRDLIPGPWESSPRQSDRAVPMPAGGYPGSPAPVAAPAGRGKAPMGGGLGALNLGSSSPKGEALIRSITATVASNSWVENGGMFGISEFEGMLIVRQTQPVHREIQQLLDKLRVAGKNHAAPQN